jgi:hypothetical protein
MEKLRFFVVLLRNTVLASGLLAAGISHADVDCSTIAACTFLTYPTSGVYAPGFQAYVSGSYLVSADLYLDDGCQTLYDTLNLDGTYSGPLYFGEEIDPPLMSGDVASWIIRFDGCPQTACLTAVAGTDICVGG